MSVAQLAIVNGAEDLEEDLVVQPVSVAYTRLHGIPMGRRNRPYFAWYGDMELAPHLWEAFQMGPIDVIVEFHDPVTIRQLGNRKALANYCEAKCREGLLRALTGLADGTAAAHGKAAAQPGAAAA